MEKKSHKKEGMKRGEKQWWSGHGRQEKGRASIRVTIMPCRQCASVCLCLFINVYSACVCLVNCLHVASCHIDQLWSFLNAADSVDFSCDWMKGYDGVHMRLPCTYHKWTGPNSLSLLGTITRPHKIQSPCNIIWLFHFSINAIILCLLPPLLYFLPR